MDGDYMKEGKRGVYLGMGGGGGGGSGWGREESEGGKFHIRGARNRRGEAERLVLLCSMIGAVRGTSLAFL